MAKRLTIQLAVEEFDLYDLYTDIVESYGDDLEDPSLNDLYELLEEFDEEFEFVPDASGDFSAGFERNLREAIALILEETEELSFVDDEFEEDEVPEIYGDEFEQDSDRYDPDLSEEEDFYED